MKRKDLVLGDLVKVAIYKVNNDWSDIAIVVELDKDVAVYWPDIHKIYTYDYDEILEVL